MDLDPEDHPEEAAARILEELWGTDGEDQLAFRRGQRFAARLERSRDCRIRGRSIEISARCCLSYHRRAGSTWTEDGPLDGRSGGPAPRAAGTTGTSRIFRGGKFLARELTDTQIRSDSSYRAPGRNRRGRLRGRGAPPVRMSSLFNRFDRSGPPLRGIVHAAANIEMIALQDLNVKDLERVFRAKVLGAWLLHLLTLQIELDFFVLFFFRRRTLGIEGPCPLCSRKPISGRSGSLSAHLWVVGPKHQLGMVGRRGNSKKQIAISPGSGSIPCPMRNVSRRFQACWPPDRFKRQFPNLTGRGSEPCWRPEDVARSWKKSQRNTKKPARISPERIWT